MYDSSSMKENRSPHSNGPSHWDTVRPRQSRYEIVSETCNSIPFRNSVSYEYGPQGHVHPLKLRGKPARVVVEFTCRVSNPYRAMFHAGEYAMNVLPPLFLERARGVLEKHSANELRDNRPAIAAAVLQSAIPLFEEYGYILESVTIGDVEPLTFAAKRPIFQEINIMEAKYKITGGQQGAVGDRSTASYFNQALTTNGVPIDLSQLANELAALRPALDAYVKDEVHRAAAHEVALAEQSAKAGDGPRTLEHLKKAGAWFWDVATKIGIGVATAIAKNALDPSR
jgi:hypothetical protein